MLESVIDRLFYPLTAHRLYFEVYRLGARILETEEEAYNQGVYGGLFDSVIDFPTIFPGSSLIIFITTNCLLKY